MRDLTAMVWRETGQSRGGGRRTPILADVGICAWIAAAGTLNVAANIAAAAGTINLLGAVTSLGLTRGCGKLP